MKKLGYLFFAWLYRLCCCFCKTRPKILFFNGHDHGLHGNLRVMYDYLQKNYGEYQLVACSKRDLFQGRDGRGRALPGKLQGSLYFFVVLPWQMATAQKVFFNDNFIPLAYMNTGGRTTQFVQLWHGAGAFKRFGLSTEQDETVRALVTKANQRISHLFVTSEQVIPYYEEAFGISRDRIYATGIPVSDLYFNSEWTKQAKQKVYQEYPMLKGRKVLLYAPTFRASEAENAKIMENFSVERIHEILGDGWIILVKLHPKYPAENIAQSKYCINMTHYYDISALYLITDLLISDYSSTVVEYVLLDKPVIMYAYDIEQYDRGFYRNYEETAPGAVAHTQAELYEFLAEKRDDLEKRQTFAKLQYDYRDSKSAERIMQILK